MKHHTQTIQDLDKSITEAMKIKRDRVKLINRMKFETERTKVLIEKLNLEYGIVRKND